MISFELRALQKVDWKNVNEIGEINIHQAYVWLNFIAKTQRAEPVVVVIKSDGCIQGYLMGLKISKYGLKILGSPFRGWGTYFMGFNLKPDVSRDEVLQAFPKFAFKKLGCHYLEIVDPNLVCDDGKGLSSYKVETLCWYKIDLTQSEDEIFANMKRTCRQNINRSIKCGVVIEEATDLEFADEYYAQYTEVMAKHSIAPTYDVEYVRTLIAKLLPTGNILMLRARDPNGLCIATAIFLALNKIAVFWGAASWRENQILRPNEALAWYGIRQMKARGLCDLHLGGNADHFKEKLGCVAVKMLRIKKAKYASLEFLLDVITAPKGDAYRNWMLRKFNRLA